MRHDRVIRFTTVVGASLLGLAALAAPAAGAPDAAATGTVLASAQPVAGQYVVVLKDADATARSTQASTALLAQRYDADVTYTYTASIRGFAAKMGADEARRLAADPSVASVQQDGIARISATQSNAVWGLDRIDQRNRPLNGTYVYNNTGSRATAYILDTGVDKRHVDFGGRVRDGYDFIDNDVDSSDCQGHGTHVAGTVGSATWGVAKQVNLVSVRVLNCQGSGQYSQIIAGVDWVTANAVKPAVANMSLGGGAFSALDSAVRNSVASGVTYALASGNSNANACNFSPARTAEAITVNATTSTDARSSFSNVGTCTDIFAPGSAIVSTRNGGGSTSLSGTSMAAPHVAGAAALFLTTNPTATPAQVASALITNATPNVVTNPGSGSPNRLPYTGSITSVS